MKAKSQKKILQGYFTDEELIKYINENFKDVRFPFKNLLTRFENCIKTSDLPITISCPTCGDNLTISEN